MKYFCIISLAVLSTTAFAQSLTVNQKSSIDSLFAGWNSTNKPGMAVGVVKDGEIVYTGTFGMSNLADRKKVDLNTNFWIASVSKQFTALGITVLENQKRITVEDDISKYLPELKHFPNIKIKHLLHHTSGLRDGYTLVGMTMRGEKNYDPASVFDMLKKQKALNFIPGTRFEYVNSNYVLLVIIIERVSGKPFPDFMKTEVFEKLGMTNARIFNKDQKEGDAIGYYLLKGKYKKNKSFLPAIGSSGSMVSLSDALTLEKHFQGKSPYLDFNTQLSSDKHQSDIRYKRGLEQYDFKGKSVISHFGTDPGFRADILRIPGDQLSIIIFSNAGDYWDLSKNLFDIAGIVLRKPDFITHWYSNDPLKIDSTLAARYVGTYMDTISGSAMRFVKHDKSIVSASAQLHGYYAPLKQLQDKVFIKQDNYDWQYDFADNHVTLHRADGDYKFIKMDAATMGNHSDINSLKGKYYSSELDKTYSITKKMNTLRLSFFHILHSPLVPLGNDVYYTEFAGGNIIRFKKMSTGKVVMKFSREGIKNLEFVIK